jgi:hypothetical protein
LVLIELLLRLLHCRKTFDLSPQTAGAGREDTRDKNRLVSLDDAGPEFTKWGSIPPRMAVLEAAARKSERR